MWRHLFQRQELGYSAHVQLSAAAADPAEELDDRFKSRVLDHARPLEDGGLHRKDGDRQSVQRIAILVGQFFGFHRWCELRGGRHCAQLKVSNSASMSLW